MNRGKSVELHRRIAFLVFNAMALAVVILFSITAIGYIRLGIVSITTIHIVVLVFCYLTGFKYSYIYGLYFGMTSFLVSWTSGTGLDIIFRNPLVSILPRLVFALLAGFIFDLIKRKSSVKNKGLYLATASGALTIFHTLMVCLMLFTFGKNQILELYGIDSTNVNAGKTLQLFFGGLMLTSMIPETIAAVILTPLVALPLNLIFKTKILPPIESYKRPVIKLNKKNPFKDFSL